MTNVNTEPNVARRHTRRQTLNKEGGYTDVVGIPTRVRKAATRRTLRQVLTRIKARRPADYVRILARVREIIPVPDPEVAMGRWRPDDGDDLDQPGVLEIYEDVDPDDLLPVLAHELGHVCTTEAVFKRRRAIDWLWGFEMAANWFACRWGFGRELRRMMRLQHWTHHCVPPGKCFETSGGGVTRVYKVSKNRVMQLVREYPTPPGYLVSMMKEAFGSAGR
jgi:hypothetical protein